MYKNKIRGFTVDACYSMKAKAKPKVEKSSKAKNWSPMKNNTQIVSSISLHSFAGQLSAYYLLEIRL